jgi:lysophospholipase L1-like esterase
MIFIGHHRLLWLDLVLIAVAINHIAISLFLRRFIKKAFLLFNAGFLALLVLFAFTLWDLLPEEHALKLHFVHDAVAPADIFQKLPDEKSGPWYGSNRIIGANTYMWKQQFGGKKITRTKANGVIRIFLVGGSQAWGSGARSSKETFCELLERRLRAKGLNVELFNAGVNGAGTSKIARYYASLIRDFSPDILIADIGLNDSAALKQIRDPVKAGEQRRAILTDFTRLARLCKEDGVGLVLVLEPMCKECPLRPDKQLYDGFTEIAIAHGGTVLDPGELLSKREKDHIVWWDTAHLAPAGHHILAGFLELAVEKIVRARQLKMNPENTLHY